MSDAARKALQRERERAGLVRAELWVDEAATAFMLVQGGLLAASEADDRGAIARAIEEQLRILCALPE
jgi:hypothetical protein